jgi:hypothetical protein
MTQIPDQVWEEQEQKLEIIKGENLSSRYSIVVKDKAAAILESRPILRWYADEQARDQLGFVEIIPFSAEATRLEILAGEDLLEEYTVTPNKPIVQDVEVTQSSSDRTNLRIHWKSEDDDGDKLTYDILYVYNQGRYSKPLALGHLETSLEYIYTDELPGSASGVVRVIASDGLNIGQGDSDSFEVPNKPPIVTIQSPVNQARILQGRTVILHGTAVDLERGPIPSDSLVWASDVEGDLGRGSEIGTRTLSPGTHEITLMAGDSDGLSGSDSIVLQIITR